MALLFMDGADCYANNTDLALKYTLSGASMSVLGSGGRTGGGMVRTTDNGSKVLTTVMKPSASGGPIHFAAWAKRTGALSGTNIELMSFRGAGAQFAALVSATGPHLGVTNWVTTAPSALANDATDAWGTAALQHIECALYVNAAGYFKVWIDGVLLINYSGNTAGVAAAAITAISLGNGGATDVDWDDIVVWDETGTFASTHLGLHKIETVRPNAAGATDSFTFAGGASAQASVNETPGPDGDTTYVQGTTAGDLELFAQAGISSVPLTIFAVQVTNIAKFINGACNIKSLLRSGTTLGTAATARTLGAGYANFCDVWEVDPATGAPWVSGLLSGLQLGVRQDS